jgi:hypothetical protein
VKSIRIWRYSVSVLTVVSLLINITLIFVLLSIGQGLRSAVAAARESLEVARAEPVELTVSINQQVPISTTVPLSETFMMPVRFDFPLSTRVTTYVTIPLLGRQEIVVPVEATIPVSQTLAIPLEITVPVNITPTLQMDVPVQVALPPEVIEALEDFIDGFEDGLRLGFR